MAKQRRHKRKTRNRGRYSGLYKVVSALLILAAVVVACAVFFRVQDVVIQGNARYTREEILEVAQVKTGDNLFQINQSRVARDLRAKLPYIQTVSVRRLLPDTLSITVTEGSAAAAISQGSRWWLLGADGKLLEEAGSPGPLPQVTGISPLAPALGTYLAAGEEQAERVRSLRELLSALEENSLLSGLNSVDLSQDYRITFLYENRLTVHLNPALERGMSYWLRRLAEAMKNPAVSPNQPYTVEISDGTQVRFIPQ